MGNTKRRRTPQPRQAEQAEPTKRAKNFVQPQVLELIRGNGGNPMTLAELMSTLNVPKSTIQHAVLKLMENIPQIEVITKGQVWRWKTTEGKVAEAPAEGVAKAGEIWYLEVGQDAEGNSIVRQEGDPKLYRVTPL